MTACNSKRVTMKIQGKIRKSNGTYFFERLHIIDIGILKISSKILRGIGVGQVFLVIESILNMIKC